MPTPTSENWSRCSVGSQGELTAETRMVELLDKMGKTSERGVFKLVKTIKRGRLQNK